MKNTIGFKYMIVVILIAIIIFITFYSSKNNIQHVNQKERLDAYINSEDKFIAEMFFDANTVEVGVQPAIVCREFYVLDKLVDRIDKDILRQFDQKYKAWLMCWAHLYSTIENDSDIQQILNCDGEEFKGLVDFCRQQNDDIFLLLYQLAARANCPFDRLLLRPVNDLLDNFPEFSKQWSEVDLYLQIEKPDLKSRTCNEATIWHTRKLLETKHNQSIYAQVYQRVSANLAYSAIR